MKIKLAISLILLLFIIVLYEYYKNNNKVIETSKDLNFVIEKDFSDVRKSIVEGKFEKEILKINNATVLEKKWTEENFRIERPLRRNRKWDFSGTMVAKVKINNEDFKDEVEIKHDIEVGDSSIKIIATLQNSIKKLGLTNLEQKIILEKNGAATLARVSVSMRVKRLIPGFMEAYAKEQLDNSARSYLEEIEKTLEDLPKTKPGISIPLKIK